MLRNSIKKSITIFIFFWISVGFASDLFTEIDPLQEEGEEIEKIPHLRGIYINHCAQPRIWKVWINKKCISSQNPQTVQGWKIVKVDKKSVTLHKGKKEKVLFIQRGNDKKNSLRKKD